MARMKPPNDHLVSRGYQNNFADVYRRVMVFDVATGASGLVPTRRNFSEPNFNTYIDSNGHTIRELERDWMQIEGTVLDRIRRITPTSRASSEAEDVVALFAIHLVRSQAFRAAHLRIAADYRDNGLLELANHPLAIRAFRNEYGRDPKPGDLTAIAKSLWEGNATSNRSFADSMRTQYNGISQMLSRFKIQVITIDPRCGGLVIGDVPVVHANTKTDQYGFRDQLAIGDADVIIGPLSRYTAVALSVGHLSIGNRLVRGYVAHTHVSTKRLLNQINAIFWRAATQVVACHPEDARDVDHLRRNLDRISLSDILTNPTVARNLGRRG